jgi:hypothetical protein
MYRYFQQCNYKAAKLETFKHYRKQISETLTAYLSFKTLLKISNVLKEQK